MNTESWKSHEWRVIRSDSKHLELDIWLKQACYSELKLRKGEASGGETEKRGFLSLYQFNVIFNDREQKTWASTFYTKTDSSYGTEKLFGLGLGWLLIFGP